MSVAREPDLEVIALHKAFGDFQALAEVNLSVAAGEFVAVMGPSGCGKTTLLRIIAGLESADTGRLRIRGNDVTDQPVNLRSTRLVWQNYALFPHLNVFGNIAFGLTLSPYDRVEVAAKVKAMADLVGMLEFLDRPIGQLSGGQKQRVALARALVTEPEILLLDEPLSALDAHLRLRMQGELRRIQRQLNMSFIYVTHNQIEAFSMADRVVVMDGGRVEQIGAPEEIYNAPATHFVARFVGSNNLFAGRVIEDADDRTVVACAHGTVVASRSGPGPSVGEEVTAVVQADKMRRSPGPTPGVNAATDANQVTATVRGREFAGSQNIYLLETVDGAEIKLIQQETFGASESLNVGEGANLVFAPEHVSLIGYANRAVQAALPAAVGM
ncbi:MAG: ABC transporter ATP-binding protein [Pseudomonadota bacterium]